MCSSDLAPTVGPRESLHGLIPLGLPVLMTHPEITLASTRRRGALTGDIGPQALRRARITGHVSDIGRHRRVAVHTLRHHESLSNIPGNDF